MCFTVAANVVREELERLYGARFTDPSWFKAGYLFSAFRLPVLPLITTQKPQWILPAHWGLIPSWVRNRDEAEKIRFKTFNARSETLFEKPSFRNPARNNHCLVPVTGFYEWHEGPVGKIPYYIYLKNRKTFSLAGITEEWVDRETGVRLTTFSIVTTAANPLLEKIHNTRKRMPVVLTPQTEQIWLLEGNTPEKAAKILKPLPDTSFGFYPVSRSIARKDADPYDEKSIQPYDYGYDPFRQGLFEGDD